MTAWIILAVYLGGFVAVLGSALAEEPRHRSTPECLAMAGSWPVAWVVVWLNYATRRAIERSNKRFLKERDEARQAGGKNG